MDLQLYNLLCDIENFLISMIDSDPDYCNYDDVESYMNAKDPDIASLYHCFKRLADKFIGKESK